MNTFSVLLVDDDRSQLEAIEDLDEDRPGLEIHYAANQREALDIIERHHLQLAIVDVSLRGDPQPDTDGVFVLTVLRTIRPSCERILLTTIQSENRREAIRALAPERGEPAMAQGLVDKLDVHLRARQLIAERASRWLHAPVQVQNLPALAQQLSDRGVVGVGISPARDKLRVTDAEVEFVLSRLFGQGDTDPDRAVDLVDEVEMNLISEGWSRSVVAWCEPRASKSGRTGPRCVVKIGPRADAEQEIQRYRSYVRYGVAFRYRVELLDHVLGDTVGAVCYSYGSGHSTVSESLQQMFDEERDEAIRCLDLLYDPQEKHLLADVTRANDLVLFFKHEYGRDSTQLIRELRRFVDRHDALNLVNENGSVKWRDEVFAIPRPEEFGSGRYIGPYSACVVHGDLHGGNVLVANDAQPVLIDYRNMTRGPRLLDFASLETSLRMLPSLVSRPESEVMGDVELERAVWNATWNKEEVSFEPYWARVSIHLHELMSQNFPDCGEWEYAATSLLRALRVFAATAVQDAHRLRLLVWISVLETRLRELAATPQG